MKFKVGDKVIPVLGGQPLREVTAVNPGDPYPCLVQSLEGPIFSYSIADIYCTNYAEVGLRSAE